MSSERCTVIIKTGRRSGRKCGRTSCIYHKPDIPESITSSTESISDSSTESISDSSLPDLSTTITPPLPEPLPNTVIPTNSPICVPLVVSVPPVVCVPPVSSLSAKFMSLFYKAQDRLDDLESVITSAELDNGLRTSVKPAEWSSEKPSVKMYSDKCILFFHTRTTGLPPPDSILPENTIAWEACRLVDISWQIFSPTCELVSEQYFLIRSEHAELCQHGILIQTLFDVLYNSFSDFSIGTIVSHDIHTDDRLILSELYRLLPSNTVSTLLDKWKNIRRECTMDMAKYLGVSEKNIDISLLYELCFGNRPETKENVSETDWCSQLYFWLRDHSIKRTYLSVHGKDKDVVKHLGAKWDQDSNLWYILTCHRFSKHVNQWFPFSSISIPLFERKKLNPSVSHSIDIQPNDKELMRFLGAVEINEKWYIPVGNAFHSYISLWCQSV